MVDQEATTDEVMLHMTTIVAAANRGEINAIAEFDPTLALMLANVACSAAVIVDYLRDA